ncbi:MAG: hypothetical protein ACOYI8_05940 [Christensenellales bacterium]
MRKMLCLMLALLLFLPCAAFAELEKGVMTKLELASAIDLDGDGSTDTVSLSVKPEDEEYPEDAVTFTLTVNGLSVEGAGYALTGELYAARLDNGYDSVLLFVPENGMSSDYACSVFLYEDEKLIAVGGIPSPAEKISVFGETLTGVIRGSSLQTWFHPGEYVLCRDYSYSEEYTPHDPVLMEAPRASYPVGTIVTLKKDIALTLTPYVDEEVMVLRAGEVAALTATDDLSWIYLSPVGADMYYEYAGGYTAIRNLQVMTADGFVDGYDAFEGLFFAD